jgi:hypothetical protein
MDMLRRISTWLAGEEPAEAELMAYARRATTMVEAQTAAELRTFRASLVGLASLEAEATAAMARYPWAADRIAELVEDRMTHLTQTAKGAARQTRFT